MRDLLLVWSSMNMIKFLNIWWIIIYIYIYILEWIGWDNFLLICIVTLSFVFEHDIEEQYIRNISMNNFGSDINVSVGECRY